MVVILLFLSLLGHNTNDIIVHLKDEAVNHSESERYVFTLDYSSLFTEEGSEFVRFEVNESLEACLSGFEYYSEKDNYSEHSPVNIDIFSHDSILIAFDDDKDGIFDDRAIIQTYSGIKNSSELLFTHKNSKEKDLRIACEFQIVTTVKGNYVLNVYYTVKSIGKISIEEEEYHISFWKSLYDFGITVNDVKFVRGNPINMGEFFYEIKAYDPIENVLVMSPIEPFEKIYGTMENMHVKKDQLEEALSFHKVDLAVFKERKYHLFYFWGHWCKPCMSSMEETSTFLNSINDDIGIYNVSLLHPRGTHDPQKVEGIVRDYNLPGVNVMEWYTSKTENTYPMVKLFDNQTYPNFVVLDSDYKILYVSAHTEMELADFINTLE